MPKRDGTPTAEEIAAAQQAGQGQPAPPPPGQPTPEQDAAAAAAAVAATAAAVAAARHATPSIAPALGAAAITTAAAGMIAAYDRFLSNRRPAQEQHVLELLAAEVPGLPEDARLEIASEETDFERQFAGKARGRLNRDLPKALSIRDEPTRNLEVQKILDRERRYVQQREEAIVVRALGEAEKRAVKAESPEGAYWRLSPSVEKHTLDCLSMGRKVWPWSVLDVHHPPLHVGCSCELVGAKQAVDEGLVTASDFQSHDQAVQALYVVEAVWDEDVLDGELKILEAVWDDR